MATFLTTAKMDRALAARVEASVSGRRKQPGRRGAGIAPRLVSVARFAAVIAVIGIVFSVVGLRRRESRDLETTRAEVVGAVRRHSTSLAEADHTSVARAEAWLVTFSRSYDGEVITDDLRAPGALAAALSRPTVYVRGAIGAFSSSRRIAEAASTSSKDALLLCLLERPASRSEKDLLTKVRVAYAGGPAMEARSAHVRRLHEAEIGLPLLTPAWEAKVKAAPELEDLKKLKRELERAPIEQAKQAARAGQLLVVMDEPGEGGGPTELDGERTHWVRVGLVEHGDRAASPGRRTNDRRRSRQSSGKKYGCAPARLGAHRPPTNRHNNGAFRPARAWSEARRPLGFGVLHCQSHGHSATAPVAPAPDPSRSSTSQASAEPPAPLTATEQRALDAIDEGAMITCLSELLRIPSISGSPEENAAQRWFEGKMRELGLETDLWEIPLAETTSHPDFPGSEVHRDSALGLVGSWGKGDGRTLVLNGHIDIVPPGDVAQWSGGDPYCGLHHHDAVYGRGACDMKGGLVCNLFAIAAIRAAGIELKGRVLLESVVGEEDGGLGTFATLQRGYRGDAAIIPEPTDLAIIPACAGALTFRLTMTGRATHASVRQEGVSTIEKFMIVWRALDELEKRRNAKKDPLFKRFPLPFPLMVGTLRAGDWPSSVPDQLVAEGRIGVALGETIEDAREDLVRALAEACATDPWLTEHPVKIEWFGGQFASGQIPSDHSLVRLVSSVHEVLEGTSPDVHGAPYGSDLRLLVGMGGIPTLHYGPGNVRHAHAPNEHVPVAHLRAVVRTLVVAILRFCGHE